MDTNTLSYYDLRYHRGTDSLVPNPAAYDLIVPPPSKDNLIKHRLR
jgi:hypothetical protein